MRALVFIGAALVLVGCGEVIPLPQPMGRPCAINSDCVPDACCGRGTMAVHVLDGPDCSRVDCSAECPVNEVGCGCGLPICRDSRCTVAVSTDPGC
jgi:hypothetical protein